MAQNNREKHPPIVSNDQIVSTKKSLGKKFSDAFVTEDLKEVKTWLIKDNIIPGIKKGLLNILSMIFFGEQFYNSDDKGRYYPDDRTSYSSYYKGKSSSKRSDFKHYNQYDSDDKVDFRNIVLRNREDAEMIVEEMRRCIRNEDSASVAYLLDLIDEPSRYTDNDWGWKDERDIGIRRISSGFLIDVAEPRYIS